MIWYPRETLEKRLDKTPSNARCFAQGSSLMCWSILESLMGTAHDAEELGLWPMGLPARPAPRADLFRITFSTLLAHTIFKNSKKAVYGALFRTGDYNTKSQKSKTLPGKSKICLVPHSHDVWNSKNGPAWASAAITANKKYVSGKTSRVKSGASIRERWLFPLYPVDACVLYRSQRYFRDRCFLSGLLYILPRS
jgi:hypothetical protein